MIDAQQIQQHLADLKDPETGRALKSTGQLLKVDVSPQRIVVHAALSSHSAPLKTDFQNQIKERLAPHCPAGIAVDVSIELIHRPVQPQGTLGVTAKSIIAVGSGKGGVGKSTVALCLALALRRAGCRVGLLDADVYGPSVPHLTGVRGQVSKQDNKIGPLSYEGMPLISIGFMVPPEQAVIWRGPMLHSAVTTFLRDVAWGDLDYLIIDMPPGTGDIALTLSQVVPITGAVIVCTPQEVALIDAIKAVAMFQQVKIPVLGIVENMSSFICPDNGKRYDIFGRGGAREYAERSGLPFLGDIPINISLRERGDQGETVLNFNDPQIAPYLEKIGWQVSHLLAQKAAAAPPTFQLPVLK